jgi:hypothetical protein
MPHRRREDFPSYFLVTFSSSKCFCFVLSVRAAMKWEGKKGGREKPKRSNFNKFSLTKQNPHQIKYCIFAFFPLHFLLFSIKYEA